MPEAVPSLPTTLSPVAQAAEPAALARTDGADAGVVTPFPQTLAQQLVRAAAADTEAKGVEGAVFTATGETDTAASLPPEGDALPPVLPPGLTLRATLAEPGEKDGAPDHTLTSSPGDAVLPQATVTQAAPITTVALVAVEAPPPALLPAVGNGANHAGSGPLEPADTASTGNNPDDAALTAFSLRARETLVRSGTDARISGSPDTGSENNIPAGSLPVSVAAPARAAIAATLLSLPEGTSTRIEGDSDSTSAVTSALAGAAHELRTPRPTIQVPIPISLPLQDPNWAQAAGQRVLWMVKNETQSAELSINPPDLGPVELRVVLNGSDQASVSFASPHAGVRDALEAAFPRLRDMLGANGLVLADVSVSSQTFAEQRQSSDYRGGAYPDLRENSIERTGEEIPARVQTVRSGIGLLDLYA